MSFPEFFRRANPFEEQFENVETLEFGSERLPSIDISPELVRGNAILFVPGWNAKIPDYKKALELLVAAGRRVVSVEPRGTEVEKAAELLSLIDLKGLESVDFVAHSVGSISASFAAIQIPERVKRMVLLNPPVSEQDPKNLIRKYKDMLSLEGARSAADIGGRKIVEMSRVITSFDLNSVRDHLSGIGTKVTSIHGLSDMLFPPPTNAVSIERTESVEAGQFVIEGSHLQVESFIPHALRLLEQ